jgi:activator of HSP90 ATPase
MEFTVNHIIPAPVEKVYQAWLNSEKHSEMTGGEAEISATIGSKFSAWDGYISGTLISLKENEEIVQSWRTTEFLDSEENSLLELSFKAVPEGTELILMHSNLPAHGEQYINGWKEHYFIPMASYFKGISS